jgi:hypothetical protein
MGATERELHVTTSLWFTTPGQDDLPTEAVWFRAGDPPTIRVLLRWADWERVARERLFGLDEETTPTNLVPDNEVVIEAQLDPEADVSFPDDENRLRARLPDPEEPLRSTRSWLATDVRQRDPLPSEEDLTDAVFDDDAEPRTHSAEIHIRPTIRGRERDVGGESGAGERGETRGGKAGGETGGGKAGGETGGRKERGEIAEAVRIGEADAPADGDEQQGGIAPDLEPVVSAFDRVGWPYEVDAESAELHTTATAADAEWTVTVRNTERNGWCTITSILPDDSSKTVANDDSSEAVDGAVARELLEYNQSLDRGGFSLDSETGEVQFRTPFRPGEESVTDAVGENVTALAEWLTRRSE